MLRVTGSNAGWALQAWPGPSITAAGFTGSHERDPAKAAGWQLPNKADTWVD